MNKTDKVTTVCYGENREWNDRQDAIRFFNECFLMSEGSERERYALILSSLISGNTVCTDEE